jgi:hypothetical protein
MLTETDRSTNLTWTLQQQIFTSSRNCYMRTDMGKRAIAVHVLMKVSCLPSHPFEIFLLGRKSGQVTNHRLMPRRYRPPLHPLSTSWNNSELSILMRERTGSERLRICISLSCHTYGSALCTESGYDVRFRGCQVAWQHEKYFVTFQNGQKIRARELNHHNYSNM